MAKRNDELGLYYYNEFLVAQDRRAFKLAKEKLVKSAEFGETMAKHALAYMEERSNKGATRRTLRLYREAAQEGFTPSAFNLARHYEDRLNKFAYFKWLNLAANLGDEDAQEELASPAPHLFKKGLLETRKSEGKVKRLLKLAAKWGNKQAKKELSKT